MHLLCSCTDWFNDPLRPAQLNAVLHRTLGAVLHLAHFAVADTGLASHTNQIRCVEVLSQDSRVDWNVRDYYGDTPIMTALKNKKKEIVEILSENPHVDLNMVDREGKHVETIARENGMAEVFNPMLGVEARVRRKAALECPVSQVKFEFQV